MNCISSKHQLLHKFLIMALFSILLCCISLLLSSLSFFTWDELLPVTLLSSEGQNNHRNWNKNRRQLYGRRHKELWIKVGFQVKSKNQQPSRDSHYNEQHTEKSKPYFLFSCSSLWKWWCQHKGEDCTFQQKTPFIAREVSPTGNLEMWIKIQGTWSS